MHLACASNRYRMGIQGTRKFHLRFDKTRGERGMHEFVCDVPSVDCVSADRRRKKLSNRPIMVVKYVELMGKFSVCDQNRHTDSVLYGWLYRLCKCAVSLALEIFCAKGCRECACRGRCDARGVAENARAAAAATPEGLPRMRVPRLLLYMLVSQCGIWPGFLLRLHAHCPRTYGF